MSEAQILETIDIFVDLNPEQLKKIYAICTEKVCSKGTIIVKENTPSTEIYLILEGEAEVIVGINSLLRNIREQRISVLQRGQSFGEIALVDQGLRSATVRCYSDTCRLLEISRNDLMNLFSENTDIGFVVMFNLACDLSLKMRQAIFHLH